MFIAFLHWLQTPYYLQDPITKAAIIAGVFIAPLVGVAFGFWISVLKEKAGYEEPFFGDD